VLTDFTMDSVLSATALVVLKVSSSFLPVIGQPFFTALQAFSPPVAADLLSQPVVRGLQSQIKSLLVNLAVLIVLGVAGTVVAVVAGPGLVAMGVGAMLVLSPVGALVVAGLLVGLLALVGTGVLIAPLLSAFQALQRLGMPVLVAAGTGLMVVVMGAQALQALLFVAGAVTGASMMATEMLTQPAIRMEADAWSEWCAPRWWALVGLGLPGFGLVYLYPLIALLLLTHMQVCGAVFLANEQKSNQISKPAPVID